MARGKRNKFFKVTFPNGKSIVVVSKKGWGGLIDLVANVQDRENTYISTISFWEFMRRSL